MAPKLLISGTGMSSAFVWAQFQQSELLADEDDEKQRTALGNVAKHLEDFVRIFITSSST